MPRVWVVAIKIGVTLLIMRGSLNFSADDKISIFYVLINLKKY